MLEKGKHYVLSIFNLGDKSYLPDPPYHILLGLERGATCQKLKAQRAYFQKKSGYLEYHRVYSTIKQIKKKKGLLTNQPSTPF